MKASFLTAALLGFVVVTATTPSRAEEQGSVAASLRARQESSWPALGAMVDVGIPDGMIGSLVVRPWKWVRGYAGGGTNSVSRGWRAGLALLPFGAGPAIALEYGSYGQGDVNSLVRSMAGGEWSGSPLLSKLEYDYVNAHAGLDFGGKYFTFFVHGGVSMVWAQLHASGSMIASSGTGTIVQVNQDPRLKAFGSSLKLGIIFYLL